MCDNEAQEPSQWLTPDDTFDFLGDFDEAAHSSELASSLDFYNNVQQPEAAAATIGNEPGRQAYQKFRSTGQQVQAQVETAQQRASRKAIAAAAAAAEANRRSQRRFREKQRVSKRRTLVEINISVTQQRNPSGCFCAPYSCSLTPAQLQLQFQIEPLVVQVKWQHLQEEAAANAAAVQKLQTENERLTGEISSLQKVASKQRPAQLVGQSPPSQVRHTCQKYQPNTECCTLKHVSLGRVLFRESTHANAWCLKLKLASTLCISCSLCALQVSVKLTLANSILYCAWSVRSTDKWTSTVHHTDEAISMYQAGRMAPQQMAILWQVYTSRETHTTQSKLYLV